jgi:hypothetical protein
MALVVVALVAAVPAQSQFKSQVEAESRISRGIVQESPTSFLFGWFDPEKFSMRHSLGFSYQAAGGQGISLGTYTNMMSYRLAENLDAQADVSMQYSPFNSLPTFGGKRQDLSSIYLSRAELNYRPWENFQVRLQYRQLPYGYYYSPFSSFWDMGY